MYSLRGRPFLLHRFSAKCCAIENTSNRRLNFEATVAKLYLISIRRIHRAVSFLRETLAKRKSMNLTRREIEISTSFVNVTLEKYCFMAGVTGYRSLIGTDHPADFVSRRSDASFSTGCIPRLMYHFIYGDDSTVSVFPHRRLVFLPQ